MAPIHPSEAPNRAVLAQRCIGIRCMQAELPACDADVSFVQHLRYLALHGPIRIGSAQSKNSPDAATFPDSLARCVGIRGKRGYIGGVYGAYIYRLFKKKNYLYIFPDRTGWGLLPSLALNICREILGYMNPYTSVSHTAVS